MATRSERTASRILTPLIFLLVGIAFAACSCGNSVSTTTTSPRVDTTGAVETTTGQSTATTATPPIPQITDMRWEEGSNVIAIYIDPWPGSWPWKMFVDGVEVPVEGSQGQAVVRPNAPLERPPTGLIVGSLPWVSGLEDTDFPPCGTIQFDIPGRGLTNLYEYDFAGLCQTKSTKACSSPWTVHEGDLVVAGSDERVIEDAKFLQKGNVYVQDGATLTLRNTEFHMERGATPTVHVYIFVDPKATLNIEGSRVYSWDGLACVMNSGTVTMKDSPTSIHYLDMSGDAHLSMTDSELVNDIGGILQVGGGSTVVSDSTIGALGLRVPSGAHLDAQGLQSGSHFASFDVHDLIPEADYDLVLNNTSLLEDFTTEPLVHGPYERGWIFFLDRDSHVRLSDSELRKVFLDIVDDTASFQGLNVSVPVDIAYRDIVLTNVKISGEWGFTIRDSDLTIDDSNYLFLQPTGSSVLTLTDSHMVEFIPREFSGTIIFENASWTNAGEILGNVPYHSTSNSFTIKGSVRLGSDLRENLQWKDAFVSREYEVVVTDSGGAPQAGVVIRVEGRDYTTDESGRATFVVEFDQSNYDQPLRLVALRGDSVIASLDIDFFTETPIRITG
jgi:hypothetical protein